MLKKRVEREKKKATKNIQRLDVRSRNKVLLGLEGWYDCENKIQPEFFPEKYRTMVNRYIESGETLKITRWLVRNNFLTIKNASEFGKLVPKPISFKISCRHKDLLRLAETNHYISCFGPLGESDPTGWQGVQQLRYLADPDISICYIPDKSGKYVWRTLLRLIFNPDGDGYAFVRYRPYGNANKHLIYKKLDEILPLYEPVPSILRRRNKDNTLVSSPTIHNNPITNHQVWSDHWIIGKNIEEKDNVNHWMKPMSHYNRQKGEKFRLQMEVKKWINE